MSIQQFLKDVFFAFSPILKIAVVGNSMTPTHTHGDVVFVNKLPYIFYQPKVRDVVLLRDPRDGRLIIKRIAKVKKNAYYVVGDFAEQSTDSRHFGWVEQKKIIGKVVGGI